MNDKSEMKKIVILIPTVNRTESLKRLLESIKSEFTYDIVIVNNWDDDKHIEYCVDLENEGIRVYYFNENAPTTRPPYPGVAASWNIALNEVYSFKYQYAVLVNDDIVFKPKSLDLMVNYADTHSDIPIIFSNQGWSAVLIARDAVEKIGFFDENFLFAYLEDVDYWHRKVF